MSINIVNVDVLEPSSLFASPFSFKISFECLQACSEVEFKLVYVGSANDEAMDQVLECVDIGPLVPGVMEFVLEGQSPNPERVPLDELLKLTAVILIGSYCGFEFFRLGYYVHYDYPDLPEVYTLIDLDLSLAQRHILADKPRITKIPINWKSVHDKLSSKDSTLEECSIGSSRLEQEN